MNKTELILYKTKDSDITIDVLIDNETVWLTQAQMGMLFDKGRTTINEHIKNVEILNPEYRKKKLIFWTIRAVFSIVLYIIFWKYVWVRYTLFLTVPVSLFSLYSITLMPYFLNKKIEKTRQEIDKIEEEFTEIEE